MIGQFRKKPVLVEAIRWTGTNLSDAHLLLGDAYITHWPHRGTIEFETPEEISASRVARAGDWIIKDGEGKFDVCKPDVFEAIYQPIDSAASAFLLTETLDKIAESGIEFDLGHSEIPEL